MNAPVTPAPSRPLRAPLKPLDDALEQLLATVVPLAATECVPTLSADGRVLAEDVVSPLEVPPHDNSSMDGYAVHTADLAPGGVLPVSQRIAAGESGTALRRGSVARIFTGAPVPHGADAIVPQEDAYVLAADAGDTARVRFAQVPRVGAWIRRQGEDVHRGECVLSKGQRLGPAEMGLAASVGLADVSVAPRPRVALFSTGDELVMPGTLSPSALPPGAVYNSNRFFLHALLLRLGCEVSDLGIVPDDRGATVAALADAARSHDLILTSGGVSVGEEDHIKPAVQQLGQLDLWQIAIKPGKPFAHGRLRAVQGESRVQGGPHFVGLPGNPVSSFVTFVLLVRPLLLRLMGVPAVAPPTVACTALFDWPRPDKRREFLRVRLAADGLTLFPNQSSGVLTSMAWCDGLVDNPAGQAIARGDTVRFIPLAALLN